MKTAEKFLIIGGDSRQLFIADYLEKYGKSVEIYALPEITRKCIKNIKQAVVDCDSIIFPLPLTKDNKNIFSIVSMKETMDEIFNFITKEKIIFAGMVSKSIESKIKNKGAIIFDYFKREDVTLMNTVPTVQGIIKAIIDNINFTIHSSKCAVFGYGRVAKITADVLSSLGGGVTICARKSADIALAEINKMHGCMISDFYKIASDYDIIVNTVPSAVIDRTILKNVKTDCLIIDVASAPFGTDFASAYEFGINAIQCPSLPGKVAPKTAGKIIADGILNILKEEGYE